MRKPGMNTVEKAFVILVGAMIFAQNVCADDSYVEVQGGSMQLMSGHSSVRMMGEDVKIIFNSTTTYDVDASFVFYNKSRSTTVLVGFPVDGQASGESLEFLSFKTFVNGKEVAVVNQYKDLEAEEDEIEEGEIPRKEKWKVKEVYFPQGEKTVTRVQYTAPYAYMSDGSIFVNYIIGTGASWHGDIGISTFTVIFPDDFDLSLFYDSPFEGSILEDKCEFMRTRNTLTWRTPEFKPGPDDTFSVYIVGHSHPWNEPPWSDHERDVFDFEYAGKPVDMRLLERLSLKQLRIFRNEIFARRGKIFKDEFLKKYFYIQPWYKQNPEFKESELNEIERENVKVISAYERKL